MIGPIHERFNQFLAATGEDPYPFGQFFEASPCMNLLLYPEPVKFKRRQRLDPDQFQYLEGCVREEASYEIPVFGSNNDRPLLYVSFGSLGSGDTKLLQRLMMAVANLPVRALFNLGDYEDQYAATEIPSNVHVATWYPQPSVIAQADAVIHHGGNNSFNECLYFGKPALIMPYVWDGHDNAQRVAETGHGLHLHRNLWSEDELARCIDQLLNDDAMKSKLAATSAHMQAHHGPSRAAEILDTLIVP
jgi:MGT family glycosyltransferase